MDAAIQQAARDARLELGRSGSPVVHGNNVDKMLEVARRRWQSFDRRNAKGARDRNAQIEDLAKGLRDHFEEDPRLAGPLIEDYRFVAAVLMAEFVPRDVV